MAKHQDTTRETEDNELDLRDFLEVALEQKLATPEEPKQFAEDWQIEYENGEPLENLVDQNSASWNQVDAWLRRVDAVRTAA